MPNTQWYEEMASALKRRDHVKGLIQKHTEALADIEHEIEQLRAMETSNDTTDGV